MKSKTEEYCHYFDLSSGRFFNSPLAKGLKDWWEQYVKEVKEKPERG